MDNRNNTSIPNNPTTPSNGAYGVPPVPQQPAHNVVQPQVVQPQVIQPQRQAMPSPVSTTPPVSYPTYEAKKPTPKAKREPLNLSELNIKTSTVYLMVGGLVGLVIGFIISLITGNSLIGGYGFAVGIFGGYGIGYLMERQSGR
jgi:hypothetical protein